MWNDLLDQDPVIQEKVAHAAAQGEEKGIEKGLTQGEVIGEVRASRTILVNVVQTRFPALTESAQRRARLILEPAALLEVINLLVAAPSEEIARYILNPSAA